MGKLDSIADELSALIASGQELYKMLSPGGARNARETFLVKYQPWYSLALRVVGAVLPDRRGDFVGLYQPAKRSRIDASTYSISDYLVGTTVFTEGIGLEEARDICRARVLQQVGVLLSVHDVLNSRLANIRSLLQIELFEHEIQTSYQLLKAGLYRAAGTIAGVILESHLSSVCQNHAIKLKKANPTIAEYDEALKNAGVLDIPTWRWIQMLADIRNLCAHSKDREPTKDEVAELISGADKATKSIA